MIYAADLQVSRLFLFKEQTYYGRCVIAYKDHGIELTELSPEESALLMEDMKRVGRAIQKTVNPAKINYGMYSDTLPHLHVHIVPKQKDGHTFGSTFEMTVNPPKYLTDAEYSALIAKIVGNL
jgi:diadenosine tetraphosphate (Ap4A) HIT family hydrolase